MVGWHHRLNGSEFEQAPEDDEGQGSLVCCSPWSHKESWGHKELDTIELLTWTELNILLYTTASLSIHLVDVHLSCFHVLAIVNCAAVNIGVHVSFSTVVFSGYMPSTRIVGSYVSFIPSFFFKESPYCPL